MVHAHFFVYSLLPPPNYERRHLTLLVTGRPYELCSFRSSLHLRETPPTEESQQGSAHISTKISAHSIFRMPDAKEVRMLGRTANLSDSLCFVINVNDYCY
jgi:hypothetical protein